MAPKASVLLPLYIYPSPGAWQPLYQTAVQYPGVDFTIIINPNSGPGDGMLPDANYTHGVATLNKLDNVRTIGYVATNWGQKDAQKVLQEVTTYSGWTSQDSSVALDGIFFDETPAQYHPDHAQYLLKVSEAVREADGFGSGCVVHNPGCVPAMQYYTDPSYVTLADVTVVFEDAYQTWLSRQSNLTSTSLPFDHGKLGCLLHSVPLMTERSLSALIEQVAGVGAHVYLTGTTNYTSFSPQFPTFVDALDRLIN
ncbi:uncharacterized protein BDZ99DRAFT_390246 [Mytilinidion resinicola]|uniref:Cell surface spherulin 4-like protein n=1 Tax=Mytilinidion resinicola TaxID=574789 RepID=A0A6A6YIH9_9PEZI|nr:uncharacterized protein BDZ99DRAFT_390246 [Mytilinidion resinicola]KAF2808369.1 hypothetical protein BDZ99DRAFT_390246 [Mytilinidion resinicola]